MTRHETHIGSVNNGLQAEQLDISGGVFNFGTGGVAKPEEECLQSLAFPDMYTQGNLEPKTPGTCQWLIEHSEYQQWYEKGGIVWLNGRAGSGKSMLMASAYEQALADAGVPSTLIMRFFINRCGDKLQHTFLELLRSLLHQLLDHQAQILRDFVITSGFIQRCTRQGEPGIQWRWSENELRTSFLQCLQTFSGVGRVKLYIDGIDEAGEEQAIKIVKYLTELITMELALNSRRSVCFACRPFPDVIWTRDFMVQVENKECRIFKSYGRLIRRSTTRRWGL